MSLSAIGAKNKKPLSRKGCLKERLSPLFRWSEESSEWELSVLSARSDLSLLLSAGNALNQQGIPESQLLSCWNDVWNVWVSSLVVVVFLSLFLCFTSSALLFQAWLSDGRSVGWGGGVALGCELAATCSPPTPSPVFLPCFLWDWRGVWF